MYIVTCAPAALGNTVFKSYWCGGRQWMEGPTDVTDAEMTDELLEALQADKTQGLGRIRVRYIDGDVQITEPKPKKSAPKSKSDKG